MTETREPQRGITIVVPGQNTREAAVAMARATYPRWVDVDGVQRDFDFIEVKYTDLAGRVRKTRCQKNSVNWEKLDRDLEIMRGDDL